VLKQLGNITKLVWKEVRERLGCKWNFCKFYLCDIVLCYRNYIFMAWVYHCSYEHSVSMLIQKFLFPFIMQLLYSQNGASLKLLKNAS